MILVDSSVWIDHFRSTNTQLVLLLGQGLVIQHPYVTAEIALGSIRDREGTIKLLGQLPQLEQVAQETLLKFVADRQIFGTGLGLVDAHLLAAIFAHGQCQIWTNDKRLDAQAAALNCRFQPG